MTTSARNTIARLAAAILSSLVLATLANAQSIAGVVRSSGAPIVGATVRVVELDRLTRTDANGSFAFTAIPAGSYRIFVSVTGYTSASQTIAVSANDTSRLTFDLAPSAVPLREIVVSASPVPRTAAEEYQSVESIGQLELLRRSGSSFAEKIGSVPGVAVRSNGSAPSRPILRGLSDNEVLVLENGLRTGDIATYDPAHATPLEAIAIQQVDVVRGPATVLYGPSTIGGLVNVITDMIPAVSDRAVAGTAAIEASSVSDQLAAYANTVLSGAHQAVRFSAGGVRARDIRIPAGTYAIPGTGFAMQLDRMPQTFDRSGEVGTGYAWQGAAATLGVGAKHYEMNYGIPGVPPNEIFDLLPPSTSRIVQSRNTVELRGVLSTATALAKQWKLTASYNDYGHSEFPTEQDSSGVSYPLASHFRKQQVNAVLQMQQQSAGRLDGTLGIWTNVEDLRISGDEPLGPNSVSTGIAGYAYEEFRASPTTRLQGALRFDHSSIHAKPGDCCDPAFISIDETRSANAVTGSLGAVGQLSRHVSASFSVARSFRVPTVQELFANGLDAPSGTYTIGTAELGPEMGIGVDASLTATFARAAFQISPYVNTLDHYIYGFLRGDTIEGLPVRQFAAARARLLGAEATVSVQPTAETDLRAMADYVRAEDLEARAPLPFIPPLRSTIRGTWQHHEYLWTAEWRMAARQTRLGDGDTPTAGYGLLNLGAGVRLVYGGMVHEVGFHADNVFDRVYRDNLSVIKDFLPQPGRGFRLTYALSY
ncbi:MAG: TonB-dependent receptor [Gemmatimonadaceae bacterium]